MKPTRALFALLAALLCGPALAQDSGVSGEISEDGVVAIGAVAMAGAAWLAYNAGDDADESQRNLMTIGAAYAVWGAAIWVNHSRTRALTLLPAERGAVVRMELRFGAAP
jgi:hypothetical protein